MLFSRLTGTSFASSARTTFTVYEPLAAAQVPSATDGAVAPAAMTPLCAPVRVFTVAPSELTTVRVMPWLPPAEATVPWFLIETEKLTVSPAAGADGDVPSVATRSELATGLTTSGAEAV